jgi:hypothetical protein
MFRLFRFAPVLGLFTSWTFGQTLTCSELSITSYAPDTIDSNVYQFSVQAQGTQSDFINYPFISSVSDCNGNLVGVGGLIWFGQFGQSVQQYPVTLNGPGNIDCYPLSISFVFQDNMGVNDTCQMLIFSDTASNGEIKSHSMPSIFPNPTSDKLTLCLSESIQSSGFVMLDLSGKKVMTGSVNAPETTIDISCFLAGSYFLVLDVFPNYPFRIQVE